MTTSRHTPRGRRLAVETLESRTLLATLLPGFEQTPVALGLYEPTSLVRADDGRLFVTEKPYGVRVISAAGELLETPVLSLPVDRAHERGVQSVLLDPQFASNGHFYVYYSRLLEGGGSANRLSRYTLSAANPNVADLASERVLLDGITTAEPGFHNGGVMAFGADGMLYLGIGDTLAASEVQNLGSLRGKILRLNPAAWPNLIPADNPFVNTPGARGEIWALGFRNPFSGAMQPGTSTLFVNDVGSSVHEEINAVVRGGNFGWPLVEGTSSNPAFVNPVHAYDGSDSGFGAAVTGGAFYTGAQFPGQYAGDYFFADYVRGFIRSLDLTTGVATDFVTDALTPVDLLPAPDGGLYWLSLGTGNNDDGGVYKINYTNANRAPQAVIGADRNSGDLPLTVNFSGAGSSDPDNDPLTYSWDFGDGAAATGLTASHQYASAGVYEVRLTVSDGQRTNTSPPFKVFAGNTAPRVQITTPVLNTTYRGGQTISFAGAATDDQDGDLPASALEWAVVFHHDDHTHPFMSGLTGVSEGQVAIPDLGETDPVQWYRIHLKATDSQGLATTTFVDVFPETSSLQLLSNPAGATLTLDGVPRTTPFTSTSVVGLRRALGAAETALIGGRMYGFTGWSDGGPATRSVSMTAGGSAYTANYAPLELAATYVANPPTAWRPGQKLTYAVTLTNVGSQTWRSSGSNRVRLGVYFGGASDAVGAWSSEPARFALPRSIAPGQSVTINVSVTAPAAPGNYVLRQRLIREPSGWFGTLHKTAVEVQTLAASYQGAAPTAWVAGKTQSYSLTVVNTGTATWKATGPERVRLGVYFGGSSDSPSSAYSTPLRIDLPRDLAPGQQATIPVTITAPLTTGNLVLRHRMVLEPSVWFAGLRKDNVTVERLSASYSGGPPASATPGQLLTYTLRVTNFGSHAWNASGPHAVQLGVYLDAASDAIGAWQTEPLRFALPANVAPGGSATITVTLTAPLGAAAYTVRHRLVKDGVAWFDSLRKTTLTVSSAATLRLP